jgi:hypothetical protein
VKDMHEDGNRTRALDTEISKLTRNQTFTCWL